MAKAISEKTFEKYKLVVDEWFINGFNGAAAYRKYYNSKRPDDSFSKIQRITEVENYIYEKKLQAEKALRTTHEGLLNELKHWAYSDITETISLTPEQIKKLSPEIRRLINKFKHTKRNITDKEGEVIQTIEVVELSFVSKEKAMEMIHKHVGFYAVDNEQRTNLIVETREERDLYLKQIEDKIRQNANS